MPEQKINTDGGTVIDGNVSTDSGNFIGRDSIYSKVNKIDGSIIVAIVCIVALVVIAILIIFRYTPKDSILLNETVTLSYQPQLAKDYLLPIEDQAYLVALLLSLRNFAPHEIHSKSTISVDTKKLILDDIRESSSMIFDADLIITGWTHVKGTEVLDDHVVLLYFVQDSAQIIEVKDSEIQELPKDFSMTSLFKVLVDHKISFSNIESNEPGVLELRAKYDDMEVAQTVLY